ncbi:dirigent protein 4-like [Herrania umbratica]|uniref:Dirigent protein n=1 Tax=Herrania umbratica TaxID=108875 RepID=A0A6J1AJJ2_9ROSI|nr:dirigent protein 4-like [Herrania umbratica]
MYFHTINKAEPMGRTLMLAWILVLCLWQILPCVPKVEKVTNLHFFLHETTGGADPTAVMVAPPDITSNDNSSPVPFGSVFAIDDPLTVGPERNSGVIGNAQGLGVSASKDTTTVVLYLDFGFTKGKFNGSSISIFSRNPVIEKERELSVVGGRGKFRMAKGFALLKTYFLNETTVIVEYNVTVIHY